MLSKFSVKRPYTVIVGVILVLILGYVSLTSMTTDLLPDIELPYSVVYTTYPGASPEEVETVISRPVEGSMATVSDIKNIQSISSENISVVILEFEETANIDSVSLEMREKLDQISAAWDDSVGAPVIMNINPNMLPVMISAVSRVGYEGARLNDYVNNELISELESISGVASVSASGGITESITISITDEKLTEVNKKISDAIGGKFVDARKELSDAKEELEDNLKKVEDGEQEVNDALEQIAAGNDEIASQMADARSEVDQKKSEISNTKVELSMQLSELKAKKAELEQTRTQLEQMKETRDGLTGNIKATKAAIKELKTLKKAYKEIQNGMAAFEKAIADIESNAEMTDEMKQGAILAITSSEEYIAAMNGLTAMETQMEAAGIKPDEIGAKLEELQTALDALNEGVAQIDAGLAGATGGEGDIDTALSQVNEGIAQIDDGIEQINDGIRQLDEGLVSVREAEELINKNESAAYYKVYEGLSQSLVAKQTLESTKKQLEQGLDQIETSSDEIDEMESDAKEQADITGIITRQMIEQVLSAQNFSMPAGYLDSDGEQVLVRVGDKFADKDELAELVIADMKLDGLEPIRLSDVADVELVDDSDQVYASIDGNPGIVLTMQKQTGYSTGDVADSIKARFASLENEVEGLSFKTLMDQGIYIDYVIDTVYMNLLYGAGLAVLVLIIFLWDFRPTLVIALSIPISLLAAIAAMYFTGVSINVISLAGLALGVGMLVDNSIVVTENIYRMRSEGVSPVKAAVEGAKEVSGAILASTLTTCCVFLPIVFTEGLTRQLFTDLGLTITYSLMASLLVALTLVPVMGRGFLSKKVEKKNSLFEKLSGLYERFIGGALRVKALVLILALVLLIGSVYFAVRKGTSLFPSMETTQMTVKMSLPEGSTVEDCIETSEEVIERIKTIDDIESVGAVLGSNSMMSLFGGGRSGNSEASVTMYIILNEESLHSNSEVKDMIMSLTEDIGCELSINTSTMDMSMLMGSGISIRVAGRDMDEIRGLAAELAERLRGIDGITEVSDGMEKSTREFRIIVDKSKAAENSLTVAQVFAAIYAEVSSAQTATTLSTDSKDYPVLVLDGDAAARDELAIMSMEVSATGTDGTTSKVKLSDIASFESAEGPSSINRYNQIRTITVSASIADGVNVGLVGDDVQDLIDEMELSDGYSIKLVGENEQITQSITELTKMLLLAIAFVYLVMVAQFQSLLMPFIVMFTLPLAFTGAFLGLIIAGFDLSIVALIGIIMLTGIIVNNGIVLVDYINILRRRGIDKRNAIVQASRMRLRPILMTSLTTILGLITMGAGVGLGSEFIQPMAVVTIGGLTYGTLTTLVVMPCMYDLLSRKKDMKETETDGE